MSSIRLDFLLPYNFPLERKSRLIPTTGERLIPTTVDSKMSVMLMLTALRINLPEEGHKINNSVGRYIQIP